MSEQVQDDKTRKTITLTHKQAGVAGGGVLAALALVTQLNGWFYPRAEADNLGRQISELKEIVKYGFAAQAAQLALHTADELHEHERLADRLHGEIKDEKDDRMRDINLVESLFKVKKTKND